MSDLISAINAVPKVITKSNEAMNTVATLKEVAKRNLENIRKLEAENARLTAELADAVQQVAELEAKLWTDMVESQPQHNQKVLFYFAGEIFLGVFSEKAMRFYTHGTQLLQARYWMELPKFPMLGNSTPKD